MQETWAWFLGREDPLEREMATHSSIFAWRIPWTEKPRGLQSMGSQRVRHDWATEQQQSSYLYGVCHYLPWHISLCTYCLLPLSKYKCLMDSKLASLTAVSPAARANLALIRHSVNRCYMNKWMNEWGSQVLNPELPESKACAINNKRFRKWWRHMSLNTTQVFSNLTLVGRIMSPSTSTSSLPESAIMFMSQNKVIVHVIKFRTEMWRGYPGLHSGPNSCTRVLKSKESWRQWSLKERWDWGGSGRRHGAGSENGRRGLQPPLQVGKSTEMGFLLKFQEGTQPCQHPDFCQRSKPDFWPTEPQKSKSVWF